jgi:hypothetical protein
MHYTIDALLAGQPVGDWYQAAKKHWQQVLSKIDSTDPSAIAAVASDEQAWFERNCGGRWIGQEIMVVTGIGQYYSTATGFDENLDKAKAMYQGLLDSGCSVEIHGHAEDMAKSYEELKE